LQNHKSENVTQSKGSKVMIKNKLVSTRLLMSASFLLSVQLSHAVKLSIDHISPIDISDDINYDISSETVEFSASEPVVCRNLSGSTNGLSAEIIDPNGDGELMPLLEDVDYNLQTQTVNVSVNNGSGVCATNNGSTFGDLIFRDQFSPAAFRFVGLNDQIVRSESVDYKIRIENINDTTMEFDLIEYVSSNPVTNAAYLESVDVWNCLSHNVSGVDCNEDNVNNRLINASIPSGGFAEIDVSRTVGSASAIGQPVAFLTALFVKNGAGEIVDVEVITQSSTVVDNSAPVISWTNSSAINFIEDDNQSQNISFNVVDNTGVNLTPAYLATAIGAVNDKLDISGINVVENQTGQFTVSFDVLPKLNQFTSTGNTEQIFVQIEDIFNASSNLLTLTVNIEPINDAPSFTPTCLDFTINPTPIGGETEITCNAGNNSTNAVWNFTDFISNISAGGAGNNTEANQNVIFEILPVSGLAITSTLIITIDPGTFILNDLMLILSDGVSGEGRFRIRALDNGTPNGQVDVCPALSVADHCGTSEYSQEIVFDVLAPVYFVSGTIDDLPSGDELGIRLFESGTTNALGSTMLIAGVGPNGGQSVKFTYPEALENGVAYDVQISLPPLSRTCSIVSGANGIINNDNVDDLVIDCN